MVLFSRINADFLNRQKPYEFCCCFLHFRYNSVMHDKKIQKGCFYLKKARMLSGRKTMYMSALSLCMVASSVPVAPQLAIAERGEAQSLFLADDIDLASKEDVSVIVELDELPEQVALAVSKELEDDLTEEEARENVEESHEHFKETLADVLDTSRSASSYVEREFTTIFNGVSVNLPANKVEELLEREGVKAIYSNDVVELIKPVEEKAIDEPVEAMMVDSIPFLGVHELHEQGLTGAGVKVGVIDTGIDYEHPDLKAVYKGGYDFVDDDDDPMEATYEDWQNSGMPEFNANGNSYYTSHGTHVSGTVAGTAENDSEYAVTGVAPEVDLYAYRVLGPYGSGTTADVIAGIEQSVIDGMDVINLSLGNNANDPIAPTSIATNNATLAGVTVVTSAGNNGRNGLGTVGAPGAAALPISVGASNVSLTIPEFSSTYQLGEEERTGDLRVIAESFTGNLEDFSNQTLELVDAGLGTVAEFEQVDVSGKVAFVIRGELAFVDKIANAKAAGAEAIIIYNNLPGDGHNPIYAGAGHNYIPSFSLTYEDGEAIASLLEDGATVTFGEMGGSVTTGDLLAEFSSRGPVNYTAAIKPEVVAPGVDVHSAVPSYMAGPEFTGDYEFAYRRSSGTSMASPHVAGVAALMIQANPEQTPADIKTKLMNTAVPMTEEYNVFEIGAGRINPVAAIESTVMIQASIDSYHVEDDLLALIQDKTGGLSFGFVSTDAGNIRERHSLRLTNSGDEAKTFNVHASFHTANGTLPAGENGLTLQTNSTVTVPAGETVENNAFLIAPKTAAEGLYGGYMTLTNVDDQSEVYRIPFGTYVSEEALVAQPIGAPVYAFDFAS